MIKTSTSSSSFGERLSVLGRSLLDYLGLGRSRRDPPVIDEDSLREFLDTRASFVAQTSLYGYLRTRAGMRYPELFDDDPFVKSINIAKWQIWLACLSDLSVFAGGLLLKHPRATTEMVGTLIQRLVNDILQQTGIPEEAGNEFAANAERVRARIAACNWNDITDDEGPFTQSPSALVRWAPVIKELKDQDEEIVTNSVRFRWQKVRQDLRNLLDADRVLGFKKESA
ncbi:MAG: esterase [Acidiferrobacterales bacterium]